jgi:hypothetical protein
MRYIFVWWKFDHLYMSTQQLLDSGLWGPSRQLRLWI